MIREFVGFNAYEAACERDTGLLGWRPCDTRNGSEFRTETFSGPSRMVFWTSAGSSGAAGRCSFSFRCTASGPFTGPMRLSPGRGGSRRGVSLRAGNC